MRRARGEGIKVSLLAIGIPVCAILFISIIGFVREKTAWRFLQLIGAVLLFMVVLAHIAEAFHPIPRMHCGENDSPGHYLDLFSAILGLILLPLGYLFRVWSRRSRRADASGN